MQVKSNFVNSKTIKSNGRDLYLTTCISSELGTFNFFTPTLIKLEYLKPVIVDFELSVYNSRLMLKFVSIK